MKKLIIAAVVFATCWTCKPVAPKNDTPQCTTNAWPTPAYCPENQWVQK